MRWQGIDRPVGPDGDALTLRLRLTAEADLSDKLTVLGEIEGATALNDGFDDGVRRNGRAFIPDPEGLAINRLQVTSETLPKTRVTLGRQRIALDDWRFIGAFPFRQNDQTFDALRLETRAIGPGILDVGYFNKALRPLGPDNAAGQFRGDSVFANYNVATPAGRFTAFHYRLDLETEQAGIVRNAASNKVSGVRLFGRRDGPISAAWDLAYARQSDHAENALNFDVDYKLIEGTIGRGQSQVTLRYEVLGSDEGHGFRTPLASLHRFQGLADQFLQTPPDGVRDFSVRVQQDFSDVGALTKVRGFVRYHGFSAASDGRSYGQEWDVRLSARLLNGLSFAIEYADYSATGFSVDTRVASISTEFSF